MFYRISVPNPNKKFVKIEYTISDINTENLILQLAAWRPGRYELQNFSRNISKLSIIDSFGLSVPFKKIDKEKWQVETKAIIEIKVIYECYTNQLDAGGCWVDEDHLYLNFIYCLVFDLNRQHEPCEVEVIVDPSYTIACGLPSAGKKLFAQSFMHLADSPMIVSKNIAHFSYAYNDTIFHLWIQGDNVLPMDLVIQLFERFTREQIETMGDFPEKEYHFIYEFVAYRQHHGVEHRNSTIITLGPSEQLAGDPLFIDFLSISSHELFHAWNIVRIRPKEMMPYDLTRENFFETGFIAEGITTYYGEYFLVRAGVISQEQYFNELNGLFKRHFENGGNHNLSLADSSFDLWVDGYVNGIPNRKVSIYVKGAVVALLLDLTLRKISKNEFSLDTVMQILYHEWGKRNVGYTVEDFKNILERFDKNVLPNLLETGVFGKTDLQKELIEILDFVGCELMTVPSKSNLEKRFGLRTCLNKDGKTSVELVEANSPAEEFLHKDDELIAVDGIKINGNANELTGNKRNIEILFFRKNKLGKAILKAEERTFFNQFRITKKQHPTAVQKENFQRWLKSDW